MDYRTLNNAGSTAAFKRRKLFSEIKRVGNEAAVAYFRITCYPGIRLDGLRNHTEESSQDGLLVESPN
jgi:hypothetical protein